jgi:hypothetical protein
MDDRRLFRRVSACAGRLASLGCEQLPTVVRPLSSPGTQGAIATTGKICLKQSIHFGQAAENQ